MTSDAYVRVLCDTCQEAEVEIELTATAHQGYDLRDIEPRLKRLGWEYDRTRDTAICENCLDVNEANS